MSATLDLPSTPRRRGEPHDIAAGMATLFRDRRLMIGSSTIVHAVTWQDWIDDLVLPAPACHQGWSGHGMHAEILPTRWPVTCRRCLRLRPEEDMPPQGVLF